MITEQGVVSRVGDQTLWVQTVAQSVCGRCVARSGCGTRVLSRIYGAPPEVPVRVSRAHAYTAGDSVEIGIHESAVVIASLIAYGVPILSLVILVGIAEVYAKPYAFLAALVGLLVGWVVSQYVQSVIVGRNFFEAHLV